VVVVEFTKIFMFAHEPVPLMEKRKLAERSLFNLVERNREFFNAAVTIDRHTIGECEAPYISIKAVMEVGPHSFQEAEIEYEKPGLFRRVQLVALRLAKKVDYRDIFFQETIAGAVFIIIFRVIVFK
jgi:hypothetical protein